MENVSWWHGGHLGYLVLSIKIVNEDETHSANGLIMMMLKDIPTCLLVMISTSAVVGREASLGGSLTPQNLYM